MSHDRFVRWNDQRPTSMQLRHVLEDYIGVGASVRYVMDCDRLFVRFREPSSFAFRRVTDDVRPLRPDRFFEVIEHEDAIDVITREQDEFVCAAADGFARRCAEFWGGTVETP